MQTVVMGLPAEASVPKGFRFTEGQPWPEPEFETTRAYPTWGQRFWWWLTRRRPEAIRVDVRKLTDAERFPDIDGCPGLETLYYCIRWYSYRAGLNDQGKESRGDLVRWPVEGEFVFNPHEVFWGTDRGLVQGLIPAYRVGDRVGLYEIIRTTGSHPYADLAGWDDGKQMTMRLVKTVDVVAVPSLHWAFPATCPRCGDIQEPNSTFGACKPGYCNTEREDLGVTSPP